MAAIEQSGYRPLLVNNVLGNPGNLPHGKLAEGYPIGATTTAPVVHQASNISGRPVKDSQKSQSCCSMGNNQPLYRKRSSQSPRQVVHMPYIDRRLLQEINPSSDPACRYIPISGKLVWTYGLIWVSVALLLSSVIVGRGIVSLSQNPMLGSSVEALVNVGALTRHHVRNGQWWRLLWAPFLHAGIFHLLMNAILWIQLGVMIEPDWGCCRTFFVFIIGAFTGNLLSCTLDPYSVSVGASGGIFGVMGGSIPYVLEYWHSIPSPRYVLAVVSGSIVVGLACGFMPYVDNYAHMGGVVGGLLAALMTLTKFEAGHDPPKLGARKRRMFVQLGGPGATSSYRSFRKSRLMMENEFADNSNPLSFEKITAVSEENELMHLKPRTLSTTESLLSTQDFEPAKKANKGDDPLMPPSAVKRRPSRRQSVSFRDEQQETVNRLVFTNREVVKETHLNNDRHESPKEADWRHPQLPFFQELVAATAMRRRTGVSNDNTAIDVGASPLGHNDSGSDIEQATLGKTSREVYGLIAAAAAAAARRNGSYAALPSSTSAIFETENFRSGAHSAQKAYPADGMRNLAQLSETLITRHGDEEVTQLRRASCDTAEINDWQQDKCATLPTHNNNSLPALQDAASVVQVRSEAWHGACVPADMEKQPSPQSIRCAFTATDKFVVSPTTTPKRHAIRHSIFQRPTAPSASVSIKTATCRVSEKMTKSGLRTPVQPSRLSLRVTRAESVDDSFRWRGLGLWITRVLSTVVLLACWAPLVYLIFFCPDCYTAPGQLVTARREARRRLEGVSLLKGPENRALFATSDLEQYLGTISTDETLPPTSVTDSPWHTTGDRSDLETLGSLLGNTLQSQSVPRKDSLKALRGNAEVLQKRLLARCIFELAEKQILEDLSDLKMNPRRDTWTQFLQESNLRSSPRLREQLKKSDRRTPQ